MRSFEIYDKWSVQANKQASKQASKHTHARAQCSHTSVGLAQARPNYLQILYRDNKGLKMSLATFRRINMFISTVKLSNSARSMEGHDQPKEHS